MFGVKRKLKFSDTNVMKKRREQKPVSSVSVANDDEFVCFIELDKNPHHDDSDHVDEDVTSVDTVNLMNEPGVLCSTPVSDGPLSLQQHTGKKIIIIINMYNDMYRTSMQFDANVSCVCIASCWLKYCLQ